MIKLFVGADYTLYLTDLNSDGEAVITDTLTLSIATKEGLPLLNDDGEEVGSLSVSVYDETRYAVNMTADMVVVANQPYLLTVVATDGEGNVLPQKLEAIGVQA